MKANAIAVLSVQECSTDAIPLSGRIQSDLFSLAEERDSKQCRLVPASLMKASAIAVLSVQECSTDAIPLSGRIQSDLFSLAEERDSKQCRLVPASLMKKR